MPGGVAARVPTIATRGASNASGRSPSPSNTRGRPALTIASSPSASRIGKLSSPRSQRCAAHQRSSRIQAARSMSLALIAARSARSAIVRATRRIRAAPRPVSRRAAQMSCHAARASHGNAAQALERARGNVRVPPPRRARQPRPLALDRGGDGGRDVARRRAWRRVGILDLDAQVEPVEQRGREPARVTRRAARRCSGTSPRPARTGTGSRTRSARSRPGTAIVPDARLTRTTRSSSGWRNDSSTATGNSGSSSRNNAPRCASVISPGRARGLPPPTSATADALWCGARNGGSARRVWPRAGARGRVDLGDLERFVARERGKDRTAGGGRASSCRRPVGRRTARGARPRPRPPSAERAKSRPRTSARSSGSSVSLVVGPAPGRVGCVGPGRSRPSGTRCSSRE